MSSWTHGAQANKMSHFSLTRTVSDFPLLIDENVTPWQPFVGASMSSTNLNNEDYFSDHPKQLPSLDALFRAQAQLSPEFFFVSSSDNPATMFAAKTITKGRYFCF
jgi:hypothetical protein